MAERKPYAAKHRAPDAPTDIVNSRGEARRRPDQHGPAKAPRKRAAKKAAPVSATPVTAPLGASKRHESERSQRLREQGEEYARRAAIRSSTTKPSITGRAGTGAIAGASAGAAIGSVVPGVGTAAGAGVGATVGGVGGAVSGAKAKRAYKAAMRTNGTVRRVIVAEFAVCIVITALSPLTDKRKGEKPADFIKRFTGVMALFLILALIGSMGRTAAKFSAGVGGLLTVALAMSERDLFTRIARIFGSDGGATAPGTGPAEADIDPGSLGGVQVEV